MTHTAQPWAGTRGRACTQCNTELAPHALSCPACRSLVHAERLKALAARAGELTESGDLADASQAWQDSLALLPPNSRQHATVTGRIEALQQRIATDSPSDPTVRDAAMSTRSKGVTAAAIGIALLIVGKLKFLILGLTKAKTFFSMFAFFGVYWTAFGWPLALGLVISIYIHEMGHVAMLRRLKIGASAPMFIPGLGAFVLLKQRIDDPKTDAAVGLAGPVWGLGAGLAAYAAHGVTGAMIWVAIAQLTGFINLFNLIPIWQLDGARAFHALSAAQRLLALGAIAVAFLLTGQKMLILVGLVAAWQVLRGKPGPGDPRSLATFIALIGVLSWMSGLEAV